LDTLIAVLVFTPLLILLWVMVRHATRIRRDIVDKERRTRKLEELDGAIVQAVLDRDEHTCQRCGTTERVGVDFTGDTPSGNDDRTTVHDLEATCTGCFFEQWRTLQKDQPDLGSRDDDRWM
jgi:5-methylcytosine-specific restriction endonuclease McrA